MWYWYVLAAMAGILVGIAIGFFIARKYMENYLKKNPPINEQMLRTLMSQKKINQMLNAMNKQMKTK